MYDGDFFTLEASMNTVQRVECRENDGDNTNVRTSVLATLTSVVQQVETGVEEIGPEKANYLVTMMDAPSVSPLEKTPVTRNSNETSSTSNNGGGGDSMVNLTSRRLEYPSVPLATIFEPEQQVMNEEEVERIFELGYDSDGEKAPYLKENDSEMEELEQSCALQVGREVGETAAAVSGELLTSVGPKDNFVLISDAELVKLKVDELREELKKRGLPKNGLKAELKERLRKAMLDKVPIMRELTVEAPTQTAVCISAIFTLL